jgi:hypothetical protein
MTTSDFAALSRDPFPVTLAGQTFLIPWRPAAEWAACLRRTELLAVLLAEEGDRDEMAQLALVSGETAQELTRESFRIIGEQTGRSMWWEGARLLATSGSPDILGRLTLAGVDPWRVSVGQWCAATYALCTQNADDKGRLRFDFSLSIPPQGFEDEWDDGGDDAEEISAAVAGMMG